MLLNRLEGEKSKAQIHIAMGEGVQSLNEVTILSR